MSIADCLFGLEDKYDLAQEFYKRGLYQRALEELGDFNEFQATVQSKEMFLKSMFLSAKCFHKLKKYKEAIKMLDWIINYPDYNHNYISRAEALRKKILSEM